MGEFFKTVMGRKFYDADVPRLATALEKIAAQMERANTLQEKKFKLDERLTKLQIREANESRASK